MKILTITTEYPPARGYGLARFARESSRALAAGGHEVHVVTPNHAGGEPTRTEDGVVVYDQTAVPPLQSYYWVSDAVLTNMWLTERAMPVAEEVKPEVVLVHDWLAALTGQTVSRAFGIPLVGMIHDTERGRRGQRLNEWPQYIAEMEDWLCREAAVVIANSQFIAQELSRAYRVPPQRIRVAHPGINPSILDIREETDIDQYRLLFAQPDEQIVLFVGRLSPTKGVQMLVEAIPHILHAHPPTKFVVAGEGVLGSALTNRAKELQAADRVVFSGHLTGQVLACAYHVADVVVVPSLYEPFGFVALEAAASGKVVVASKTGGLTEVLADNPAAVWLEPGKVESLVEGVGQALVQNSELAKTAMENSEAVCRRFQWSATATKMAQAFEDAGMYERPKT